MNTAAPPRCPAGEHTFTPPEDPDVRAVRCTRCNQPIPLYRAWSICFCGRPTLLSSNYCPLHT